MQNKKPDLRRPRIGIDVMGCDTPPQKLIEAISKASFEGKHPPILMLFATKEAVQLSSPSEGIEFEIVSEVIEMDDDPLSAVRRKKESSMAVAIQKLKNFELDAVISAGNTGALLTLSKLQLQTLPGIDRPALITLIPTKLEPIAVIDIGANVQVKPENLFQFAKMGIAFQKARGISHPTVGLLNIGEEKQKGTPELREAYQLLQSLNTTLSNPVFLGNIEGRDVFRGKIDVLVTDGFTGNVFLKTSEGIAGFVMEEMSKLGPIESLPGVRSIFNALRQRLHYAEYPGALLCGVEGIVMKCHGESPPESFISSIKSASRLVEHFFIETLKREL